MRPSGECTSRPVAVRDFVRSVIGRSAAPGLVIAGSLLLHVQAARAQTISVSPGQITNVATTTVTVINSTGPLGFGDTAGGTVSGWSCLDVVPFTCTATYTPPSTFVGTDTITVTQASGAPLTTTVMIYPANLAANNIAASAVATGPTAVNLVASGDPSYYATLPGIQVSVSQPAHGTATASGTLVTYTPNGTYAGNDSFTYTVSDGYPGQSATGTISVAVSQPSVTVPADLAGKTAAAGSAELTAAGFAVTLAQAYSTSVPAGDVVTSQPAPGAAAPRYSTIQLEISRGPGAVSGGPISSVPGLTPEQASTARGVEKTCAALAQASDSGTPLTPAQQDLLQKCTALIADYSGGTNLSGLQQAMNAISGREVTAAGRMPMQFAAGQIANIDDRLRAVRAGEGGVSFAGLDTGLPAGAQFALQPLLQLVRGALGGGAGADAPGGLFDNRLGAFVTGTLRQGSESTTDAEEGFGYKDSGLTAGADYRLGTAYVLGLAGGYGRSHALFADEDGRLDARHWSTSLYGSYYRGRFHLDALAGFEHSSFALGRDISYASSSGSVDCGGGECITSASGATGGREYLLSASAGMDFNTGALAWGPTLGADYKQMRVEGFTESGPSGLDLAYAGMTTDSLLAKLGAYVSYTVKTRWAVLLPQLELRYLHEFRNDARTENVGFAADTLPGASARAFQVYTDSLNRNYLDWRASLQLQLPYGIAGFIEYGAISGLQTIEAHEFNIGMRIETGAF